MGYSRIAKNARLGDGCVWRGNANINAFIMFTSTDLSYLKLKKTTCNTEGFTAGKIGTQKSGYGGTKTIYKFETRVDTRITEVYNASISELIMTLDKEDLILWYLDDGSWHKTRNTMHLYSNMLDDEESLLLIGQIGRMYGIKPRLRKDRKKDGRSFNYLYFPRELVKLFRPEVKEYIECHKLESMYYKVGGKDYVEKDAIAPLTDEEVRTIRSMYEGNRGDIQRIIEATGVSRDRVRGVVSNQTYRHVI